MGVLEDRIDTGRRRKADRIARELHNTGVDAATAARFDNATRRRVEADARVRPASPETWRLAIDMLAGSTRPGARCITCGIGMPGGVPGPPKPHGHQGECSI